MTQYDEKGKIFTQIVSKHPVRMVVQTATHLIRGTMHVRPNARVKDDLNGNEEFIALTDVIVYTPNQEEAYHSSFIVVNTNHIIWVIPDEETNR